MANMVATKRPTTSRPAAPRATPIPRALREKAEALLAENYPFMDSPIFKNKGIEKELFSFDRDKEPELPLTSWYQPTRDDALDPSTAGAPQLMKAAEERLMFLRFNYSKMRLCRLQKRVQRDGLTR